MEILLGILALQVAILPLARKDDRPILAMILISVSYYAVGGYWYWGENLGGVFMEKSWGADSVLFTAQILALSGLTLSFFIALLSPLAGKIRTGGFKQTNPDCASEKMPTAYWIMFFLGMVASAFVLRRGSFASDPNADYGPFFRIAYQFSDLLIPLLIYTFATRGYTRFSIAVLLYFMMYAVLVGFRYKLALLFLPILWDLFSSDRSIFFKTGATAITGLGSLVLFGVMTLYRAKFGIPDLSVPLSDPVAQLTYGFMADTNILFGLNSILANYVATGLHYPLDPILDTFKEWVPRFILPDRVTGGYVSQMQVGFAVPGAVSTAWPWIGEFLIMFGWPAMLLGPLMMSLVYTLAKYGLIVSRPTARQYAFGLALIAAMIGYYQFSRGYMPQATKGYLFVVLPYLYLCNTRRVRAHSPASRSKETQARAV